MPSLPLYTPSPFADGSHRVLAPGGYERWHFDAESNDGTVRVVMGFAQGWVDRPDYWGDFDRYLRRPTRRPPPVPADYASLSFALYEHARPLARFARSLAATDFRAAADRLELTGGPGAVTGGANGDFRLRLSDPAASVDLRFKPLRDARCAEIDLSPGAGQRSLHHWVVPAPWCAVEGRIQTPAGPGNNDLSFAGLGYHDHDYGTAPVARSSPGRLRGRLLNASAAVAFTIDGPEEPGGARAAHLLHAGPDGFQHEATGVQFETQNRSAGRGFPEAVMFERTGLRLSRPVVLDAGAGRVQLLYEAAGGILRDGEKGSALCEWVGAPASGLERLRARARARRRRVAWE